MNIFLLLQADLNDDPFKSFVFYAKNWLRKGDDTPITGLYRDMRYTEKTRNA
ncbi:MAG: hypothetical protein IPL12_08285 [Bacteroidetes bacterium]|nr:hypothetical protein [Bacteroidota bacterium]